MNTTGKYIAIIPARGGSKRLPGKNILPLKNKPLIAWSIEAAIGCSKIDQVVVSSDDNEILNVAGLLSVETIKRPDALASDIATTFDAIQHTLQQHPNYEYTVLLQPTSPLRNAQHITSAIDVLESNNADAVVSICETSDNPLWCNVVPNDLSMNNFLREEVQGLRSQDLPTYYRLNGAIYICKTEILLKQKSFFLRNNIYAYIMDEKSSVDIDTDMDFKWAEFLIGYDNNV